jgi:hypothetical protein
MKCTCGSRAVGSNFHSAWCDTTNSTIWSEILERSKKTTYITVVTKNNPQDSFSKVKDISEAERLMTIENTDFYSIVLYNGSTIDFVPKDNKSYLDRSIVDCMFLEVEANEPVDQTIYKYSRGDVICFNSISGKRTSS